jgi:hypothetical protein
MVHTQVHRHGLHSGQLLRIHTRDPGKLSMCTPRSAERQRVAQCFLGNTRRRESDKLKVLSSHLAQVDASHSEMRMSNVPFV